MKTILVADDDSVSRSLIRDILDPRRYEVVEACNGREALERIAERAPDLLLLDVQMPLLDGFAVLRQVRGDPRFPGLPVAAVTAMAMPGECGKALATGFDAVITKPIVPAALRAQVQALVG